MAYDLSNIADRSVILGLSGGVDSAVAAILLAQAGARVQALHMTNWADDDGYCTAARDLQDARHICEQLGITLHHVDFSAEYRERVFASFLEEYRRGRTPNPDVLCNREIKFGVFRDYARRLGGELLATGHYARTAAAGRQTCLLKGVDPDKDQSYFLHAVSAAALADTVFPLGELRKNEVREIARDHGLAVHGKKDSTGICFIGERPFREFLENYLPAKPGPVRDLGGRELGTHAGLMYYTLGQRQGIGIGGRKDAGDLPWYVVDKDLARNALIVDQGDSPHLFSDRLHADQAQWINGPPAGLAQGSRLGVKIRYRQSDQPCRVSQRGNGSLRIDFDSPQRAVAPGQYAVFYDGERCLGGAVIERASSCAGHAAKRPATANS